MGTMPTRIDGELFAAAKAAGARHSRSAAQQLDHWARLGREFETAPGTTVAAVERVLAGEAAYDEVDEGAQAAIRAAWNAELDRMADGIDLTDRLPASDLPWVEADEDGTLVRGPADRRS